MNSQADAIAACERGNAILSPAIESAASALVAMTRANTCAMWAVSMPSRPLRLLSAGLSTLVLAAMALPGMASKTVTLLPSQDAPIYADDGVTSIAFASHANGAGETLYVGTNGTGSARRSLLQFDLSVLPQGTAISAAKLTLFCDREPGSEYETLALYRVTEAWTTGRSNSDALGTPGQGAPAEPGDSTWYYRSWPSAERPEGLKWCRPGASFDTSVIASQKVGPLSVGGDRSSVYVWSSPAMTANLNAWLADPGCPLGENGTALAAT